ncbi:acyl activating enzyme 12 [Artemisia annua]|uniref:Acyl activating enzyme 12 n=1 Tax=Artemisia annua TaxID=35608 RepID=A0A2U1LCV0_ARTAN|nr:acyl activating enzyme 12 [Artemisia annua]
MAGAVLTAINTRLDANNIATILRHSEAKVFFVGFEYVPIASQALRLLVESVKDNPSGQLAIPLVIVIDDINKPTGFLLGKSEYEQLIHHGNPQYPGEELEDKWMHLRLITHLEQPLTPKEWCIATMVRSLAQ